MSQLIFFLAKKKIKQNDMLIKQEKKVHTSVSFGVVQYNSTISPFWLPKNHSTLNYVHSFAQANFRFYVVDFHFLKFFFIPFLYM